MTAVNDGGQAVPMRSSLPEHSLVLPQAGVAPIQRNVSAKRLLRSLDETYYAGLSDAHKRSFTLQGAELSRS